MGGGDCFFCFFEVTAPPDFDVSCGFHVYYINYIQLVFFISCIHGRICNQLKRNEILRMPIYLCKLLTTHHVTKHLETPSLGSV